MNIKSIVAVVFVAILIGVLYVLFEKNSSGTISLNTSKSTSSQELAKDLPGQTTSKQDSLLIYPSPEPSAAPITSSTDLLKEAESLEMRDYSGLFEELKDTVSK